MDIAVIDDFFSQEELSVFLQNDVVKQKYNDLHLFSFKTPAKRALMSEEGDADCAYSMRNGVSDSVKKIRFSLDLTDLPDSVLQKIQLLGVTCNGTLPMTWISEDSLSHIDQGVTDFNHTVVIYLTTALAATASAITDCP